MFNESIYKDSVHAFSKADINRLFAFTSGHIGAIFITDEDMAYLFDKSNILAILAAASIVIIEVGKFIFNLILPLRNLGLVGRTVLRKLGSQQPPSLQDLTVFSLGNQPRDKDAYFGVLLKQINEQYNYVKIVGGMTLRGKGYGFVESNLTFTGLFKLLLMAIFSPLEYIAYLLVIGRKVAGGRQRFLFIILGMKEINKGTVFGNKIISDSMASHLRKGEVKKILFPMEGRNWEKNCIRSAKNHLVYSMGYVHCALTPRHLSLTQPGFFEHEELPSRIIAPGAMAFDLLSRIFPDVSIIKGFFLRGSKVAVNAPAKHADLLLFALTGDINESEHIMSHVAGLRLQQNSKLVIRLNPNTSTYVHLANYARKLNLNLYMPSDATLPGLCFFRSSSVAIDYLKADVIPVYLGLNEIISNNIFELDNKYQFENLQVDERFNVNMGAVIDKTYNQKINGAEAANYYLDQRYDADQLLRLIH